MNKYKVCVYAICKNEEKNINSWVKSMKEADQIYVLDTGSTDNSVDLLNSLGVKVKEVKINPWRFDEARNLSLDMVPKDTDICVCTDIDERFERGWRAHLEKSWRSNTTILSYNYNWNFDKLGNPTTSFYINKIHSRNNYLWINPVHEVLKNKYNDEKKVINDSIILNHYQDVNKNRASYLPLLKLSIKENPNNDRNMHYLGREYMYYKKWNKCIDTLIKHINLKSATWRDEKCASMRYIAFCYINLKRYYEAECWFIRAIEESPYLREPYYELAYMLFLQNNFTKSKEYLLKCLSIKQKSKSYLNESYCWDGSVEDMLSICEFYLGNIVSSLKYAKKSYRFNPRDERIKNNISIIKKFLRKT